MRFSNLVVIFLTFSQISLNISSAIMKNEILKKPKKKSAANSKLPVSGGKTSTINNKYYQLFVGLILGLTNINEKTINSLQNCLPSSWLSTDTSPGPNDVANKQTSSGWTAILNGVQQVLGMICKFKSQIKALLTAKLRRQVKRSQYKMLMQRTIRRYKRATQFWSDITSAISSAVGAVENFATAVWDDVKSLATGVVKNITVFIDSIRQTVNNYLTPIQNFINKFNKCVKTAKNAAKKVISAVNKLLGLVNKIVLIVAGDMVALGGLVIDLICNFSIFRKAFNYLSSSQNTTDTLTKWGLIGKFIGTFLKAISARRNK